MCTSLSKEADTAEEGDVERRKRERRGRRRRAVPSVFVLLGGGQQSESGSEVAMPFSETARERRHATSHAVVKWASHISLRLGRSPE